MLYSRILLIPKNKIGNNVGEIRSLIPYRLKSRYRPSSFTQRKGRPGTEPHFRKMVVCCLCATMNYIAMPSEAIHAYKILLARTQHWATPKQWGHV